MGATEHRFKVGDIVIFTNCFGVCWGVKEIIALDWRNGPTYHYANSDTPWFSVAEEHFCLADTEDIIVDMWRIDEWAYFQRKYGFTPSDYGGCW